MWFGPGVEAMPRMPPVYGSSTIATALFARVRRTTSFAVCSAAAWMSVSSVSISRLPLRGCSSVTGEIGSPWVSFVNISRPSAPWSTGW